MPARPQAGIDGLMGRRAWGVERRWYSLAVAVVVQNRGVRGEEQAVGREMWAVIFSCKR